MHLLYTDETNADGQHEFFVYAGVSIPIDKAKALSESVQEVRVKAHYAMTDLLKFDTRSRGEFVSADEHKQAKKEVIAAAAEHGVKLFASFLLKAIANNDLDQARRYEINRVCYHFDCFLNRQGDIGMVFVDTFEGGLAEILRRKWQLGLEWGGGQATRMRQILGFNPAHMGTSHFSSVVDVVLGSLRFVVNNSHLREREATCRILLEQLDPLWVKEDGGDVHELSMFFSPARVRHRPYYETYMGLRARLAELGCIARHQPSSG